MIAMNRNHMQEAFDACWNTVGHVQGRGEKGSGAHRPDWVNAASLQQALKGSAAVGHMKAAAERDRRLALSAALARQQVELQVNSAGMTQHLNILQSRLQISSSMLWHVVGDI